jgi:hypothetical protein
MSYPPGRDAAPVPSLPPPVQRCQHSNEIDHAEGEEDDSEGDGKAEMCRQTNREVLVGDRSRPISLSSPISPISRATPMTAQPRTSEVHAFPFPGSV